MLVPILLFAFFAIGVKVVLAVAVLYALLPERSTCARCDADTISVRVSRCLAPVYRLLRLERRWCPECGLSHHAHADRDARVWVGLHAAGGERTRAVPTRRA